jgi:hypothetical protein
MNLITAHDGPATASRSAHAIRGHAPDAPAYPLHSTLCPLLTLTRCAAARLPVASWWPPSRGRRCPGSIDLDALSPVWYPSVVVRHASPRRLLPSAARCRPRAEAGPAVEWLTRSPAAAAAQQGRPAHTRLSVSRCPVSHTSASASVGCACRHAGCRCLHVSLRSGLLRPTASSASASACGHKKEEPS